MRSEVRYSRAVLPMLELTIASLFGLLFVQPNDDPSGDFLFCPYAWSNDERDAFLQHGHLPASPGHLPPQTPQIPLLYYTREARADFYGPAMSDVQFERLDTTAAPRLIVLDLLSLSDDQARPLYLISSDYIAFTSEQRTRLTTNIGSQRANQRPTKTPLLGHLLKSGRWPGDYRISNNGAILYESGSVNWAELWRLLRCLTMLERVEHPKGNVLSSTRYQHTLQSIHQRYAGLRMNQIRGKTMLPPPDQGQ
jgi:hypothetical protein